MLTGFNKSTVFALSWENNSLLSIFISYQNVMQSRYSFDFGLASAWLCEKGILICEVTDVAVNL